MREARNIQKKALKASGALFGFLLVETKAIGAIVKAAMACLYTTNTLGLIPLRKAALVKRATPA